MTLAFDRSVIYTDEFALSNAVVLSGPLKEKEISFAEWIEKRVPQILKMATTSSSSGISVEGRLAEIESSLGRLRGRVDRHDNKLEEVSHAGEKTWDLLNEDLRKLRAEQSTSSEKLEEFKDEVRTGFKDEANMLGDFGTRLSDLETAVANLASKLNK